MHVPGVAEERWRCHSFFPVLLFGWWSPTDTPRTADQQKSPAAGSAASNKSYHNEILAVVVKPAGPTMNAAAVQ